MKLTIYDRAALYLCLFGEEQIRDIITAATSQPGALEQSYREVRNSPAAPPAVLAMATSGRIAEEDVQAMMSGIGYMFYSSMRREWNKNEYEKALITLFGITPARAAEYAAKIETPESEGKVAFLARMAKKFGDTLLGPLWDPDTSKQDLDLPYELVQFGRMAGECAKQVMYAAAPWEGLKPGTMSVISASGDVTPIGDIDQIPDTGDLQIDEEALGDYFDGFAGHYGPDALPPSEQGGAKKRKKRKGFFRKLMKGIGKLAKSKLFKGLVGMIPGVGPAFTATMGVVDAARGLAGKGDINTVGDYLDMGHADMLSRMRSSVSAQLEYGAPTPSVMEQSNSQSGYPLEMTIRHEQVSPKGGPVFYPGENVRMDEMDKMSEGPRVGTQQSY